MKIRDIRATPVNIPFTASYRTGPSPRALPGRGCLSRRTLWRRLPQELTRSPTYPPTIAIITITLAPGASGVARVARSPSTKTLI